ncbi:trem-like transcript 4 protein isoform X2 [Bombina bombina]|uniref:trem-like transcript 4 protein isoform X2 n=1 Tax=Bombina bombina TaxID=8345 RepID=UPI00235A848F|nr:trem-like transcript 4 protein isoform X2 [Bombina bombina]
MHTSCLTLLIFSCLMGLYDAKNKTVLSAYSGETIIIQCPYKPYSYRWEKKQWCKEDDAGQCHSVVSARRYWSYTKRINGSIYIYDDINEGFVQVNMSDLKPEDAGMYQCQSVYYGGVRLLKRIEVRVLEKMIPSDLPEMERVQKIISGKPQRFPSESSTLFIIGSSVLFIKVLLLGVVYVWGRSRYKVRVDPEPYLLSTSEESIPAETIQIGSLDASPNEYMYETPTLVPLYINHVLMKTHPNRANWQT